VEPAWKALDALRRSKTVEDLFLRASFDGLGTHLQIANWITKTLDRICQSADTRTHTHYTADVDYDICLGHPHLWACAVARVADVEGLSAEALSACIDSNFGFLEHTSTALTSKKTGGHEIGTGAPCLVAAPPSTRKSRLIQYTDSLCTDSRFAPDELKKRQFHMGDATTKGIRPQLLLVCMNCCVLSHCSQDQRHEKDSHTLLFHFDSDTARG
jgi:hypothetical protein